MGTETRFRGVRAVAFDMDGVLVDSEAVNLGSAFEAFAEVGHPLADDARSVIVGRHPDDYVGDLAARTGIDAGLVPRIREIQDARYVESWRELVRLGDGAAESLKTLGKRGLKVALTTSSSRVHVDHCLERFSLRDYFDLLLTKEDVARRKPDPEIYLLCAERLGVRCRELLVVEDSEHGARAALAAGTICAAIRTPYTAAERLAGAHAIVDSLLEIPRLIE